MAPANNECHFETKRTRLYATLAKLEEEANQPSPEFRGSQVRISDLGVWIPELLVARGVRRVPSFRARVRFSG